MKLLPNKIWDSYYKYLGKEDKAIKSFWCGDETRRCYMEKAPKQKKGRRKAAPAEDKMRQCPKNTWQPHDLDLGNFGSF